MKNTKLLPLGYWFSFLFILLWMTSCGTRKTQKTETDILIELDETNDTEGVLVIKDTSNVKTETVVTMDEETTTKRKTYIPIDPSKPSSYTDEKGNKKSLDNASYTEEETTSKNKGSTKSNTEASSGKKIDANVKSKGAKKAKVKVKSKGKETTKTYSWWNLLWLFWLVIPILAYYIKNRISKSKLKNDE